MTGFQRVCGMIVMFMGMTKRKSNICLLCACFGKMYTIGAGVGAGITQWRNYKCIVNNVNQIHIKVHNIELIFYSALCLLFFKKAYWSFSGNSSNFWPISVPQGHLEQSRQPRPHCWVREVAFSATWGKNENAL